VHLGRVTAFDGITGIGTVEDDRGVGFLFHCVEIADGTRAIEPGTDVVFDVLSKLGAGEAVEIVKLHR